MSRRVPSVLSEVRRDAEREREYTSRLDTEHKQLVAHIHAKERKLERERAQLRALDVERVATAARVDAERERGEAAAASRRALGEHAVEGVRDDALIRDDVATRLPLPARHSAASAGSVHTEVKRKAESEREYKDRLAAEQVRLERQVERTGNPLERHRARLEQLERQRARLEATLARAEARIERDRARIAAIDAERRAAHESEADALLEAARHDAAVGSYWHYSGRYSALNDYLRDRLDNRRFSRTLTHLFEVLHMLNRLRYEFRHNNITPREYWDAHTEDLRAHGLSQEERYIDEAPTSYDEQAPLAGERAFNRWYELVLRRILREPIPPEALPIPRSITVPRADVDEDWL